MPSTNLLAMTGAELAFDDAAQAYLPVELPSNVHAAGAVAGARSVDAAVTQGRLAGLEAAAAVGRDVDVERIGALAREAEAAGDPVILPPEASALDGKQFGCLCMDVTNKELKKAVAEGFDSMELLKRYTTITMGPCQGKACMLSSQRLCARATGSSFAETKPTTSRPPWTPVDLGTLAGARRTPRKETTIHELHDTAGATFMWAGDWRRPHHYSTPEDEVDGVRNRVGVIDVSTLGKFRVKGPQAVDLLERLYPNRFSDLAVGRIRYGVMLNDEGVILDDGAVCRVDDDEFFVTVTTGNTAALERWITWWLADWRLDVQILNVTGAFAALNLAGPEGADRHGARDGRRRVGRRGCRTWRAGPSTSPGCPRSSCGSGSWGRWGTRSTCRACSASPSGARSWRPARIRASRRSVWRRSGSSGWRSSTSWSGRTPTPSRIRTKRASAGWSRTTSRTSWGSAPCAISSAPDPASGSIGFTSDPAWVPPEGASVVHEGVWVGRVTSARRSAAAGATVGLAWVPAGWANEGTEFEIQFGPSHAAAHVALRPFYDPDGERLRS